MPTIVYPFSVPDLSPSPAGTYASPSSVVVDAKGRVTAITAGSGGGGYQPALSVDTNVWFTWDAVVHSGVAAGADNDTIRAHPFWSGRGGTLSKLKAYIGNNTAGAKIRFGVYTMKASEWYPDALVSGSDAGEVDAATSGDKTSNITAVLAANTWYWLASLDNNTSLTHLLISTSTTGYHGGGIWKPGNSGAVAGWTATQSYGAMPSSYPAGGTLRAGIDAKVPLLAVQFSAVN